MAMDSAGRLFVGDRQNNRIQIFDQDGKFIDQWTQFSRPSGIYIDKNDVIYVADSESESSRRTMTAGNAHSRRQRQGYGDGVHPDPVEKSNTTSAEASRGMPGIYGRQRSCF